LIVLLILILINCGLFIILLGWNAKSFVVIINIHYDFSRRVPLSIRNRLLRLIPLAVQMHLYKIPYPFDSLWFQFSPKLLKGTERHPLSGFVLIASHLKHTEETRCQEMNEKLDDCGNEAPYEPGVHHSLLLGGGEVGLRVDKVNQAHVSTPVLVLHALGDDEHMRAGEARCEGVCLERQQPGIQGVKNVPGSLLFLHATLFMLIHIC
jgi:hypothetical protein